MARAQLRPGEGAKPAAKKIQKPEQMLSNQARTMLSNADDKELKGNGFSTNLIKAVELMLVEAENVNKREGRELPDSLAGYRTKTISRSGITLPDIELYAVTRSRGAVYETLKSPEGQVFMRRYYDQLYRDQNTGQWMIEPLAKKSEKPPKTRLARIVPARRNL